MNKIINTRNAPKAIGPYSQAVISNGLIFTAGQICLKPDSGELNDEDFITEVEQVFENIKAILENADTNMSKIVKCTVYITDLNNFAIVNQIFEKYFKNRPPARSVVEVSKLPKNVNIEIDVIASL
tara:strand:+ start:892 stop:1269 length:378 start_codon:yes stop_codon:yes gene_type:complete